MEPLYPDGLAKVMEYVDYQSRARIRGSCKLIKNTVDKVGLAVLINGKDGEAEGIQDVVIKEATILILKRPEMFNFGSTKTIILTHLINDTFFIKDLSTLPNLTSLVLAQDLLTRNDFKFDDNENIRTFPKLKYLSITLSEHALPENMNVFLKSALIKRMDNNMKYLMENINSNTLETLEIKLDIAAAGTNVKIIWDRIPLETFMNKHKATLKRAYITHPTQDPDISKKLQLQSLFLVGNEDLEYGCLNKLGTSQKKLQEFGCVDMKFQKSQCAERIYNSILNNNYATLKYFNVAIATWDCKFGQTFDFGCFENLSSLKVLRYKRGVPGGCKGLHKIPSSVEYLTLDGFTANVDADIFKFLNKHKDLKELKILHKMHVKATNSRSTEEQMKTFLRTILRHRSLCHVECQFYHFPPNSDFLSSFTLESLSPWINPRSGQGDEIANKLRLVEFNMVPYTLPQNSANYCVYVHHIKPNPLTDYFVEETGHIYKSQYDEILELPSYMDAFALAGPKIQPNVPELNASSFTMLKNSQSGITKVIPHYKSLTARFNDMNNFKIRNIFDVGREDQKKMKVALEKLGGGEIGTLEAFLTLKPVANAE